MTREETKKARQVMQHFEDGGEIEAIDRFDTDSTWQVTSDPTWDWHGENFRIKLPSVKVTEEEKKIIGRSLIWTKCKKTGHVDYYLTNEIDSYPNNFFILNPDTMEWEDWSEK